MKVLGIDPGLERIGYGFIEKQGSRLECIDYGLIETPRISLQDRLILVHEKLAQKIELLKPDQIATEKLIFAVNRKTAMDVAKSLGVILYTIARHNVPWTEYSPNEVKQAVVGHGKADKKQIQFMVTRLLGLPVEPKPDDVADALGIAICHTMHARIKSVA